MAAGGFLSRGDPLALALGSAHHPGAQDAQGQELKLADLLDPMDKSVLKELQETIAAKDAEAFRAK